VSRLSPPDSTYKAGAALGRRPSAGLRHVPPVAVELSPTDVWHGLKAMFQPDHALAQFQTALAEKLLPFSPIGGGTAAATDVPLPPAAAGEIEGGCLPFSPFLVSSGRAALTMILLALRGKSDSGSSACRRSQVAIPAYGCPTVVQAVLAAGLEPIFCDVSPHTLDFDRGALERLVSDRLLAVVPTHLYGLAQDIAGLVDLGRENGFFVVEDAAQALGAAIRGRMVGTQGDAGFYSLGRGKCLPVGHGGIAVCRAQHESAFSEVLRRQTLPLVTKPAPTGAEGERHGGPAGIRSLAVFLGYGLATHPRAWWWVVRSPLNPAAAGMDVADLPPLRMAGLTAVQAGIGHSLLARLEQIQANWRSNARRLMEVLARHSFVTLPEIPAAADPVFLRLPLVTASVGQADRLFHVLSREGIGVSRSYYRTLPDLYAVQLAGRPGFLPGSNYPGAAHLAGCLLTLPTNSHLGDPDLARIARAFERADGASLLAGP
jgi:perosamine synthetase